MGQTAGARRAPDGPSKRVFLAGRRRRLAALACILALSGYAHAWNSDGFPWLHGDESIYILRAERVLESEISYGYYDHPYMGQIALAGLLAASSHSPADSGPGALASHFERPRAIMGVLAVLDTFLIYMVARTAYGVRQGLLASAMFAVMPALLVVRMVTLDSLLLPFALASVLLALRAGAGGRARAVAVIASGAAMGCAIFTKIPAAALIPLGAFLACSVTGRLRYAVLWLACALAVPSAWPASAAWDGDFAGWLYDVAVQGARTNTGLWSVIEVYNGIDPALLWAGAAGLAVALAARDRLVLLWLVPPLAFSAAIGFFSYYHAPFLLAGACVAAAVAACRLADRLPRMRTVALAGFAAAACGPGLAVTAAAVNSDVTAAQHESFAFATSLSERTGARLAAPTLSYTLDLYEGEYEARPYPAPAEGELVVGLGGGWDALEQFGPAVRTFAPPRLDFSPLPHDLYRYEGPDHLVRYTGDYSNSTGTALPSLSQANMSPSS